MKNKIILLAVGVFIAGLAVYGLWKKSGSEATTTKAIKGAQTFNEALTYARGLWKNNPEDVTAFVTAESLIFKDAKGALIKTFALPEETFYVAVAPYKNRTHECAIHYLSSCQGEMKNESFDIKVYDLEDKSVFLKQEIETLDDGFFELFLPKGKRFSIEIESKDGLKTKGEISTFPDAKTCLTTAFKLS